MHFFRNHTKTQMEFGSGINVILGENGSGKTSILEAVYLLSMGRSFRTNRLIDMVKNNEDSVRAEGVFDIKGEDEHILFGLATDGRKKLKINGKEIKGTKALLGKNPVILLSPEEQTITKGTAGNRRTYFNKLFSVVSTEYMNTLVRYTKILKQRNTCLKEKRSDRDLLVWDEPIAETGTRLWKKRKNLLLAFQRELVDVTRDYEDKAVHIDIYSDKAKPIDKQEYILAMKKSKQKDKTVGRTTVGPHRDEIGFCYNDKCLKAYGSQGEHKLSLVLIKLAEFNLVKKLIQKTPTLLLDDLFAKLDFQRGDSVLKLLNKKAQTLVTNTDMVEIERHGIVLNGGDNKSFFLER